MIQENLTVPIVAALVVKNDENTVFKSIEKIVQFADILVIVTDNSVDKSMREINKFIRRRSPKNVVIFDSTRIELWKNVPNDDEKICNAHCDFKAQSIARQILSSDALFVCSKPCQELIDSKISKKDIYSVANTWADKSREFSVLEIYKNTKIPVFLLSSALFPSPFSTIEKTMSYIENKNIVSVSPTTTIVYDKQGHI